MSADALFPICVFSLNRCHSLKDSLVALVPKWYPDKLIKASLAVYEGGIFIYMPSAPKVIVPGYVLSFRKRLFRVSSFHFKWCVILKLSALYYCKKAECHLFIKKRTMFGPLKSFNILTRFLAGERQRFMEMESQCTGISSLFHNIWYRLKYFQTYTIPVLPIPSFPTFCPDEKFK